jgi:peptide/nickel transport system substrate-binding protein
MKRRLSITLLVVIGAAVALALFGPAASGSGSRKDAPVPLLRVGLANKFSILDLTRNDVSVWGTSAVLEQLVQVGADGKLKPWLARSVSQPSPSVYIYRLRKGVKFWDGSELTAADVANALNYNRRAGSLGAYLFPAVKSVTAKDRYTVVVALKYPDASFTWVPAQYPGEIFQKAFAGAHKGTLGQPGVLTMGTGPWKIESFDPTRGLDLVADDAYWGGAPQIRKISIKFFSDENSMALAFRAGEIDVAPQVGQPQAFASAAHTTLLSSPSCQTSFLSLNTKVPPFNDVHVRRAVAYALNRADLIKAKGGYATPNYTLIPRIQLDSIASKAQVDGLLKSLPTYTYSLAKAKGEMAKSKTPDGFSTTMLEPSFDNLPQISEVVAAQLAKIGIKVHVKQIEDAVWEKDLTGPKDKVGPVLTSSGCNSPDPSFYTYVLGKKNLVQGGFNIADYAPPALEPLITGGVATSNPARRFAIYSKILRQLATDVPYVPVWVQNGTAAVSSKFSWPTFSATWYNRVWPLEIHPK